MPSRFGFLYKALRDLLLGRGHSTCFRIIIILLFILLYILEAYMAKSSNPSFILPYGPKVRVSLTCSGKGARQSFKDECDINVILSRYQATGVIDPALLRQGRYLDVTGADFRAAMSLVADGKSAFHSLPSSVRERFDNDPARFLEFAEDPANGAELVKMGLATVRKPKAESGAAPGEGVAAPAAAPKAQPGGEAGAEGGGPKARGEAPRVAV